MHITSHNVWYYVLPAALLLGTVFYAATEFYQARQNSAYTPYEPLHDLLISGERFKVSVADTPDERQQGLSYTTTLPPDVLKLFVFDTDDTWVFWMKEMNYPIDIIWLDQQGKVVHIAANVAPETFPEKFRTPVPARYVMETNAGLTQEKGIIIGMTLNIASVLSQVK
jgi:uncharacterized membrane protein (UPF0127 family)